MSDSIEKLQAVNKRLRGEQADLQVIASDEAVARHLVAENARLQAELHLKTGTGLPNFDALLERLSAGDLTDSQFLMESNEMMEAALSAQGKALPKAETFELNGEIIRDDIDWGEKLVAALGGKDSPWSISEHQHKARVLGRSPNSRASESEAKREAGKKLTATEECLAQKGKPYLKPPPVYSGFTKRLLDFHGCTSLEQLHEKKQQERLNLHVAKINLRNAPASDSASTLTLTATEECRRAKGL